MRILKGGAVAAAGLGLVALTLEGLASFAGVRVSGFSPLFTPLVADLERIASLLLASAVLYLIARTSALKREIETVAKRTKPEKAPSVTEGPPSEPDRESFIAESPGHPEDRGAPVPTSQLSRPVILLERVSRMYDLGPVKVHALREASLRIPHGSLVVVLGPSGSGKTTLLNLLGGIDRATSGTIRVDGVEVTDLDDARIVDYRREKVGFVFQFFNLIPSLTARENVALAAELVPNAMRVEDALRAVGLAERMDHFPAELSGGEQQRVAIARALVKNPPILLCDEPTGELDYATGVRILEILQGIAHRGGRAVVVVTHNAAIAEMADLVVRLRGGRVDQVLRNPEPVAPQSLRW